HGSLRPHKNLACLEPPIDSSYPMLKKHFKPDNFVAFERAKFSVPSPSESQSVRDFVPQLQTQAAKCEYGAQLEDQPRDPVIADINSPELQQKLLMHHDQRLQIIRNICEQHKDKIIRSQFHKNSGTAHHVDAINPGIRVPKDRPIASTVAKWPEDFLTTSPSADFTQHALRKVFWGEGVRAALVNDNGTHFTVNSLGEWIKGLGCQHLFTALRHPQSNGLAGNFVRTLKSAIASLTSNSFVELDREVDRFLVQY
ncbi:uncharacterized protein DEA37_0006477, partial [Paragonimus westermani]